MTSVDIEQLKSLRTLDQVFRFGMAQSPRWTSADVVIQDECTHDVLFRVSEHTVLVFDTT